MTRRRFTTIATSGTAAWDIAQRQARQAAQDEADRRHAVKARREMAKLIERQAATLYELSAPLRHLQAQVDAKNAELDAFVMGDNE